MDEDEFEDYDREVELALYREYRDVVGQFKYVVETERRFYLANDVQLERHGRAVPADDHVQGAQRAAGQLTRHVRAGRGEQTVVHPGQTGGARQAGSYGRDRSQRLRRRNLTQQDGRCLPDAEHDRRHGLPSLGRRQPGQALQEVRRARVVHAFNGSTASCTCPYPG
jgi:hypothetical protein